LRGTLAWRNGWADVAGRDVVALIAITPLSGDVIRLATRDVQTTEVWSGLVLDGSVQASSSVGLTDVALAPMRFRCLNGMLATGDELVSVLGGNDYIGATVVLQLWNARLSYVDALTRYVGKLQSYSTTLTEVVFNCLQDRDWNRFVRPRTVTREEFPYAPEDSLGVALPVVLGEVRSLPLREPLFSEPYGWLHYSRERVYGGSRASQCVVVDSGVGAGSTSSTLTVMAAGHACVGLGASWSSVTEPPAGTEFGTSLFYSADGSTLSVIEPSSADIFNTPSGAGFKLPANAPIAYYPVWPVEVADAGYIPGNPNTFPNALRIRSMLDRFNDGAFASIYKSAQVYRPTVYPLFDNKSDNGDVVGYEVVLVYRTTGAMLVGTGHALRVGYAPTGSTAYTLNLAPSADWKRVSIAWTSSAALPLTTPWAVDELDVRVTQRTGSVVIPNGTIDVAVLGLAVKYRPRTDLVQQTKLVTAAAVPRTEDGKQHTSYTHKTIVTDVPVLKGKWYASIKGHPDTIDGRYSGTASALVERPCDVAHLVLGQFGSVPVNGVEMESGKVGSFFDARTLHVSSTGSPLKVAVSVTQDMDVRTLLNYVGESALTQFRLSEFDSKWHCLPWTIAPPVTYDATIKADDLLEGGIELDMTPDSDVLSGVNVSYGYSPLSGGYAHEVSVAAGTSSGGHSNHGLADAAPFEFVAGTTDRLDWQVTTRGATSAGQPVWQLYSAALTPTVHANKYAMAAAVNDALSAAAPTGGTGLDLRKYVCAFSERIVSGTNNELRLQSPDFFDVSCSIPAGTYGSMVELAQAAEGALNSIVNGYTQGAFRVSYSEQSGLFSIRHLTTPAGGFPTGSWRIYPSTGWLALGLAPDIRSYDGEVLPRSIGASSLFGTSKRRVGLPYVGCTNGDVVWLWQSGVNGEWGLNRCAARVLGFVTFTDSNRSPSLAGTVLRTDRQSAYALMDSKFGTSPPVRIDGRAINDTATALELRNRLSDLKSRPRAIVKFRTEAHGGLEVGDVFMFDASVDGLQRCAMPNSAGTWAGKPMRVLTVAATFGSSWHTEVEAVDLSE
jgi:hypothetical protein